MSAEPPPNYSDLLIQRLAALPDVRLAYLFGSRAAHSPAFETAVS